MNALGVPPEKAICRKSHLAALYLAAPACHRLREGSGQREAVAIAQYSLHLSHRSFEVGNSCILQVLASERIYQRALSGLVEARARQYRDVTRLYVATAGGWVGNAAAR